MSRSKPFWAGLWIMPISPMSTSTPPTSTAAWAATCRWSPGPWWWQSATAARKPKGYNALGYREVLGNSFGEGFAYAVGDSEAEAFWRQFLSSLKERGLTGTRLVISDAHLGLTAAIKRMFQGCSWQRCRVHFLCNLLSHVPKVGQDMVAAAM